MRFSFLRITHSSQELSDSCCCSRRLASNNLRPIIQSSYQSQCSCYDCMLSAIWHYGDERISSFRLKLFKLCSAGKDLYICRLRATPCSLIREMFHAMHRAGSEVLPGPIKGRLARHPSPIHLTSEAALPTSISFMLLVSTPRAHSRYLPLLLLRWKGSSGRCCRRRASPHQASPSAQLKDKAHVRASHVGRRR